MSNVRNAFVTCVIASALASAAVDPGLLNLVMPDAKFVSGIQVEASKNSPFGKYVLAQMQSDDAGFTKFIADTGFDPRRDLTEIVVGTAGTSDQPVFLAAGRGRFTPSAIFTAAQSHGATLTNYAGVDILTHPTRHSTEGALAFLDATTAVMGTLDAVHGAIDRYKSNAVLPGSVSDKAVQLSSANDAWFVSTGPVTDFFTSKTADAKVAPVMQANLLQAVLQANGGIKFTDAGVQITGEALTRSAKDATALADVVRFLAGMVQLNRDKDPQAQKVATLLDSLTLSTKDATMQLSLLMPEALVEQLFVPGAKSPTGTRVRQRAAAH